MNEVGDFAYDYVWTVYYIHYDQAGSGRYSIVQDFERSAKVWSFFKRSVKVAAVRRGGRTRKPRLATGFDRATGIRESPS